MARYYQCSSCFRFTNSKYIDFFGWKCIYCQNGVSEKGIEVDDITKQGVCAGLNCNQPINVKTGTSRYCNSCNSTSVQNNFYSISNIPQSNVKQNEYNGLNSINRLSSINKNVKSRNFSVDLGIKKTITKPQKLKITPNSNKKIQQVVKQNRYNIFKSNFNSEFNNNAPTHNQSITLTNITNNRIFKVNVLNNTQEILAIGMYYSKKNLNLRGNEDDFTKLALDLKKIKNILLIT